jgi:hypothetical protein
MKKLLILLFFASLIQTNKTYAQFKIVGYIPNWANLTTFSDSFDYPRVTHLNIAFMDPSTSGDPPALSADEIYLVNAAHNNGVQVLVSLCGGGSSDDVTTQNLYFNLIQSANVIYYKGISTIIDKTNLTKSSGGGVMLWDLSLDASGDNSLLKWVRSTAGNVVTATIKSVDDKNLSIFPNPSNSLFTLQDIDLSQTTIEVHNTLSEKINIVLGGYSIDLSGNPKGI